LELLFQTGSGREQRGDPVRLGGLGFLYSVEPVGKITILGVKGDAGEQAKEEKPGQSTMIRAQ
jgi:hypothetical protein